jgi:hypothetical protein
MIQGCFTPEQRAVLKEIAKRPRARRGDLQKLAEQWDRSVDSVRDAVHYIRKLGGNYKGRDRRTRPRVMQPGPYTLRMRRIWADWETGSA